MTRTPYNAYFILDTRHAKSNNTYPLKLRIIVDRKSFHISLGFAIEQKYWKSEREQIMSSCKSITNVSRANRKMQQQKTEVLERLGILEDRGTLRTMTMKEVKAFLLGESDRTMVLHFGAQVIEEMTTAGKVGNARVYKTMLRSVDTFLKGKDLAFDALNYRWLKKYEAWYLGKGNSINGLAVHMRTLRALYNRAIKEYPKLKEFYPFDAYSVKHEKTRKRAIGKEDIEKLKNTEPQTQRQNRAKDYFFMSFYLMGASFIDLAFLKLSDISKGRIQYKRKKTGQLHNIKITAALQEILDKYTAGKKKNDYILNVVKGTTEQEKYTAARDELRRYNRALKELSTLAGLDEPITSYTARHSFATIAKYKGVPTAVISEALGHSSEEVTQVYLDSFDKEVLDKYNEVIVGE